MRFSLQRLLAAVTLVAALTRPAIAQNTITLEGAVKADGAPLVGARSRSSTWRRRSRPGR